MTVFPLHGRAWTAQGARLPGQRPRWFRPLAAMVMAGLFAGCAAIGPTPEGAGGTGAGPDDGGGSRPELTGDVLYKLLIGELARHRGDLPLAVENYLAVARETRDAAVAARAAEIAAFSGAPGKALEAARLWSEVDPSSVEARQALASLLIRAGDLDGAIEHLTEIVGATSYPPGAGFGRAAEILSGEKDEEAAIAVMKRLVATHDDTAAAQLALARLLSRTGRFEEASAVFDRASELDPDDARIAILRARVRWRMDDLEGALGAMAEFLDRVPDSSTVRMAYARMLVDTRRYEQARAEFEHLVADEPGNDDARYALGLLFLQTEQLDEAARQFERLATEHDGSRRDTAYYYLARIAESQERLDDAIASYRRVRRGEHRLNAQIRAAVLLAEGGEVESARRHLHGLYGADGQESVRIYRAEAELLARAGRYDDAMAVYNASLKEFPGNFDLLYARGMLAERMDRLDVLERDMREILSHDPDNAEALNALGYTLADRTDRYEEAHTLIKRAFELKPDDHYIVDSMGWILYRMGQHRKALEMLRRAMSIRSDPEIAAHLGEVLWVLGEQAEARRVWDAALEVAPDDERLLDVIKRFVP